MSATGVIFDIQSFSVHDGPGCRTTVFMSGCPLSCRWCANPESWSRKPQILFSEMSCKYNQGCTACQGMCPEGGLGFDQENKPVLDFAICHSCTTLVCAEACYNNALKRCAKEYTVDELMSILQRDSNNWRSNGGVTFSGGDPLAQSEFLLTVLKRCQNNNMHTAIETSGFVQPKVFAEVMKYIDFAFIDVKHMNREKHLENTGVYNDLIHNNIAMLTHSGWQGRLVLRMPVIQGFNDDDDNIAQLIQFMQTQGIVEINILPFHRLGESKWNQLGKPYDYSTTGEISTVRLEEIQEKFLEEGKIGRAHV